MNVLKIVGAAATALCLTAGIALADTPQSQQQAEHIYNLQQKAARQQANAAKAESNGDYARANQLRQEANFDSLRAGQMYQGRKHERVSVSRRESFKAMRDEQIANHDAKIGDESQSDAYRREAAVRQHESNNVRNHYGRSDLVHNPSTGGYE